MRNGGYIAEDESSEIAIRLKEIAEMSIEQKLKHQGDKYIKNKRFATALNYYERLLDKLESSNNRGQETDFVIGDIYHNIGVVYANMFLFERAVRFFDKAYEQNHKEISRLCSEKANQMMEKGLNDFKDAGKKILENAGETDIEKVLEDIRRQASGMCEHGII